MATVTTTGRNLASRLYEYALREDILLSLEYNDLTDSQARALLKSEDILSDAFKDFEKKETGYMEDVCETVKSRANILPERQKQDKEMER